MGLQRVGHDLVIKTQKMVCKECIYPVSRYMMASLPAANCKISETAGLLSDLELNLHQFLVGLEKQKEIPDTVSISLRHKGYCVEFTGPWKVLLPQ